MTDKNSNGRLFSNLNNDTDTLFARLLNDLNCSRW